ncbi:MAG: hypothetical protein ACHQDE_01625, partial [Acidimicrobiia bacterium]
MRSVDHSDLSPVADRLLVLQFVRVFVVAALLLVPVISGTTTHDVVALALAYLAFTGVVELARRRASERAPELISWAVLVDGLVISLAIALSGGYHSPLLFLVF